jgi:FixJ family two-component response regulator
MSGSAKATGPFCIHKKEVPLLDIPVVSIIDDDEFVRAATTRLVRSLGFIAPTFASADEFLRSPHLNDTSCVISDVQMPGIGGLELQRMLIAKGKNVPIIFMTAFPDERLRAQTMEGGAACFLSKPFDGATLSHCINKALKMLPDQR